MKNETKFTQYLGIIFYKIIDDKIAIQVNTGSYPDISVCSNDVAIRDVLGDELKLCSEKDFKIAYNTIREKLHKLAMGEPMTNPHAVGAINPKSTK